MGFACGEDIKYAPILELSDPQEIHTKSSKLFIPFKVEDMELETVHFEIGNSQNLLLPIHFYANNEYPDINKKGYATVLFGVTPESMENINVLALYKHPVGANGEITFCFHTESFKLTELIDI